MKKGFNRGSEAEKRGRKRLMNAYLLTTVGVAVFMALIIMADEGVFSGVSHKLAVGMAIIALACPLIHLMQVDHEVRLYICPSCGQESRPSFWASVVSIQMFNKRYMKCGCCGKRGWHRTQIREE